MNSYESLIEEACKDGIDITERKFNSERIKGLYCDGNIALNKDLETSAEKACTLAEELGHHHTSVGNILDMDLTGNRKQEHQARLWAYDKLIGLRRIINAFQHGCQNRYEIAEYLKVTEEFLEECVACYRDKYGIGITLDDYYIMFIPTLAVGEIDYSI